MCTAISFNGFFGRTLDYECGFGEEPTVIPRGFEFKFRHRDSIKSRYSIVGMARTEESYPLFFDALNEKGVAMAGLNFTKSAHYRKAQEGDVASFELIPYILSQADSVDSAVSLMQNIGIADTAFSPSLPPSSLHWIIADKSKTAVIESTKNGVNIYDDPVGVMTNEPPFPYQLMNLNNYINLSHSPAQNRFSKSLDITPISRGMGAIGLPGDWSSQSRFVRAAFVRENALREKSVSHFFRIMSSVSVPKGCMMLENGDAEYTRYTSCMDLENGIYCYTTYEDNGYHKIKEM